MVPVYPRLRGFLGCKIFSTKIRDVPENWDKWITLVRHKHKLLSSREE